MNVNLQDSVYLVTGSDQDNQQFGSAFAFYSDDQTAYFLTCRHVVTDVGGPDQVRIGGFPATVVASGSERGPDDLAVLQVESMGEVPTLKLNDSAETGSSVKVLGFQAFDQRFLVRPLQAQLGERVGLEARQGSGRVVAWDLMIEGDYDLERGYSGGPVIDGKSFEVVAVANYRLGGRKGVALSVEILEKIWPTAVDKIGTLDKEAKDQSRSSLGVLQDDPNHVVEEQKPLPTFEIGTCTEGSPFEMECTGEIVGGLQAAQRAVEEIKWDTNPSDPRRYAVRVAGIERHREYLSSMSEASGTDREERHKSRKALRDWEKHLDVFCSSVEFVLWNKTFRENAYMDDDAEDAAEVDAEDAAEVICGLSEYCFTRPSFPVKWWLWYPGDRQSRRWFGLTEDIEESMRRGYYEDDHGSIPRTRGLYEYRAYTPLFFSPPVLHQYLLPPLLIFVAERKIKGTPQATLGRYLDVSQWRWSVSDPIEFVEW